MLYKYLTTMKKILFILLFLNSILCFSQKNFTMDEFNKITDNGEKWKSDIKIFMYGDYTIEDSLSVIKSIELFNKLIETVDISIVSTIELSNSVIYFITDDEFIKLFKWSEKDIKNCTGITYTSHVDDRIVKSKIHIDIVECRKHQCTPITIRHEMFHMLGFDHQDNEKNTILKSHSIEFTEKDREMISLLYKK